MDYKTPHLKKVTLKYQDASPFPRLRERALVTSLNHYEMDVVLFVFIDI